MVKEITNPHLSPSRAVAPARERAKRRQGRMWAALLSNEIHVVRSAEVVTMAEGKTARTAMVRSGRAPRCRRTQARMYVQSWDLGGLPATTMRCNVVAKVKADAKRRMDGGEESNLGIVPTKPANKTWDATRRSGWREGLGATGACGRRNAGRTQSREMRWGRMPCSGPPVEMRLRTTAAPYGVMSIPERGAGCVSAHVRI